MRFQFPKIALRYLPTPPRHPSDTPTRPPDTPLSPPWIKRHQQTPTDTARHTQTAPVSVWGCLLASFVICCRLLSSVDILSSMEMSGGVFRGCLGVSEGYSWKLEALRRVWGVTGIPVLTVWSRNIILAQPWNAQLFLLDQTKASKYQNVFVKGLQKSLGYGIFLFFSAHQKEIINYSCNRSPCNSDHEPISTARILEG